MGGASGSHTGTPTAIGSALGPKPETEAGGSSPNSR